MVFLNLTSFAFATILTSSNYQNTPNVINWVKQLHCHGIPSEHIIVVIDEDVNTQILMSSIATKQCTIKIIPTGSLLDHPENAIEYAKLWLWSFTDWYRIVYYDSNYLLLRTPVECLRLCPPSIPLCAIANRSTSADRDQFNSGVLILTPSYTTFRRVQRFISTTVVDHNVLNRAFVSWYPLPDKCNLMNDASVAAADTVAVSHPVTLTTHPLRRCLLPA